MLLLYLAKINAALPQYQTTTTACLTALYPGRPRWVGTRRNTHSVTPCLCGYYTTLLIIFLHFLWSIA